MRVGKIFMSETYSNSNMETRFYPICFTFYIYFIVKRTKKVVKYGNL